MGFNYGAVCKWFQTRRWHHKVAMRECIVPIDYSNLLKARKLSVDCVSKKH